MKTGMNKENESHEYFYYVLFSRIVFCNIVYFKFVFHFFFLCFSRFISLDQKIRPNLTTETLNFISKQEDNQKNFRLIVHEKNKNTFTDAVVTQDHILPAKNQLNNEHTNRTMEINKANVKYDESTLSRCALLFLGALCQQGKIVKKIVKC